MLPEHIDLSSVQNSHHAQKSRTSVMELAVWSGMLGTADSGPADTEDTALHRQSQTAHITILLYIICRDPLILNEMDVI